jgi:hypothetical protein
MNKVIFNIAESARKKYVIDKLNSKDQSCPKYSLGKIELQIQCTYENRLAQYIPEPLKKELFVDLPIHLEICKDCKSNYDEYAARMIGREIKIIS